MPAFEAMEENLRTTLAVFARATPAGATRPYAGVSVASSGVEFAMFNAAVLTSPVWTRDDLALRIETAAAFYAARRIPWSFWVCDGWIDRPVRREVSSVFSAHGLHVVTELPGMSASALPPARRSLPDLEFRRVDDATTRTAFNYVMASTFGIPFPVSRQVYESKDIWETVFTGWIGYAGGLPVTTAATVSAGGVIGVYGVATVQECQRRGYAEAVMRHALGDACRRHAIQTSVLESSEAGYALYARMGYETIARYAVFAYS